MPLRGSALLLLAVTGLYAFANAGLGLALASVARSSGQVGLLAILVTMPMIQLSGTFSPIESMPQGLQYAVTLSPLLHFVNVAYGIVFRGDGVRELWPAILAIGTIGAAFFAFGLWRFRGALR